MSKKKTDNFPWNAGIPGTWEIECPYLNQRTKERWYLKDAALFCVRKWVHIYDPFYVAMGMPETFLLYHSHDGSDTVKKRLTTREITYIAEGITQDGKV